MSAKLLNKPVLKNKINAFSHNSLWSSDKSKIIALLLLSLVMAALFIGYGLTADNYEYFLSRRVPKVLAMVIAGFAIGIASFCFQTITNNRILTPSIMGFDSLYLLIQVLVVTLFGGLSVMMTNHVIITINEQTKTDSAS